MSLAKRTRVALGELSRNVLSAKKPCRGEKNRESSRGNFIPTGRGIPRTPPLGAGIIDRQRNGEVFGASGACAADEGPSAEAVVLAGKPKVEEGAGPALVGPKADYQESRSDDSKDQKLAGRSPQKDQGAEPGEDLARQVEIEPTKNLIPNGRQLARTPPTVAGETTSSTECLEGARQANTSNEVPIGAQLSRALVLRPEESVSAASEAHVESQSSKLSAKEDSRIGRPVEDPLHSSAKRGAKEVERSGRAPTTELQQADAGSENHGGRPGQQPTPARDLQVCRKNYIPAGNTLARTPPGRFRGVAPSAPAQEESELREMDQDLASEDASSESAHDTNPAVLGEDDVAAPRASNEEKPCEFLGHLDTDIDVRRQKSIGINESLATGAGDRAFLRHRKNVSKYEELKWSFEAANKDHRRVLEKSEQIKYKTERLREDFGGRKQRFDRAVTDLREKGVLGKDQVPGSEKEVVALIETLEKELSSHREHSQSLQGAIAGLETARVRGDPSADVGSLLREKIVKQQKLLAALDQKLAETDTEHSELSRETQALQSQQRALRHELAALQDTASHDTLCGPSVKRLFRRNRVVFSALRVLAKIPQTTALRVAPL